MFTPIDLGYLLGRIKTMHCPTCEIEPKGPSLFSSSAALRFRFRGKTQKILITQLGKNLV